MRLILFRVLQVIPQLLVASFIIFLVMAATPGDPAMVRLGQDATPEQLELERVRMGLDKPLIERYGIWLTDALHGDLGRSFATGQLVVTMVGNAFPRTLALAGLALLGALTLGLITGLWAGLRQGGAVDVALVWTNSLIMAVPPFFVGIMLVVVFAVWLRVLPPSGAGAHFLDLRFLALPAIAVGLGQASIFSRFVRASVVAVTSEEFVRTARAKGLRSGTIVFNYILRNALLPLVTIVGIQASRLLGGAVVVESVFVYPGMGRLAVEAINNRDYAVVQGVLLVVLAVFFILNLVVDLSYALLDPRLRHNWSG